MSRTCCSTEPSVASSDELTLTGLKLYQTFIFSVPIFFTFVLLFVFYLFYLRRRSADWSSLRLQTMLENNNGLSRAELGLNKEVREMLPIIIYNESFSIRDTQCSVCLGDYQGEDRLQQIPACGHAFHMECIDNWLSKHTTCPLCRLSLLRSTQTPLADAGDHRSYNVGDNLILQSRPQTLEQTPSLSSTEEEVRSPRCIAPCENECEDASNEMEKHHLSGEAPIHAD